MRLGLDAIAAWRFLFSGEANNFLAVAKAHIHYVDWLFFRQKKSLFSPNKNKNLQGLYKGCIVWDYFIKRKNSFLKIFFHFNELSIFFHKN